MVTDLRVFLAVLGLLQRCGAMLSPADLRAFLTGLGVGGVVVPLALFLADLLFLLIFPFPFGIFIHIRYLIKEEIKKTRAPRGTDRSPEYNEQLEKAPH